MPLIRCTNVFYKGDYPVTLPISKFLLEFQTFDFVMYKLVTIVITTYVYVVLCVCVFFFLLLLCCCFYQLHVQLNHLVQKC